MNHWHSWEYKQRTHNPKGHQKMLGFSSPSKTSPVAEFTAIFGASSSSGTATKVPKIPAPKKNKGGAPNGNGNAKIGKGRQATVSIRMNSELKAELETLAKADSRSLSTLIALICENHVKKA
jgi:hypothetical protein